MIAAFFVTGRIIIASLDQRLLGEFLLVSLYSCEVAASFQRVMSTRMQFS
jgi:hypothetical protein